MTTKLDPSDIPRLGERNLTADHVWIDLSHTIQRSEQATPALFLDRDGVIVVDAHYLGDPDQVALLPGAGQLVKAANTARVPVVVVTNQSGIGRGYFDWEAFEAVQQRIEDLLSAHEGAKWDAVLACPHHRDALPPYRHPDHPCRKPNPGMFTDARDILNIDLSRSWIIGDKAGDLEAGKRAGLTGGVHVATHPDVAEQEHGKSLALDCDHFHVVTRPDVVGVWDAISY